jgi:hypothetical protein
MVPAYKWLRRCANSCGVIWALPPSAGRDPILQPAIAYNTGQAADVKK